jgi:hypothetical protein
MPPPIAVIAGEQHGGQPVQPVRERDKRPGGRPQRDRRGVHQHEHPVPRLVLDVDHERQAGPGQRGGYVGRMYQCGRRPVLQQDVADDPAAKPGDQAHRPEPEQVQVLAARDGATEQSVGEDAEQVKDGDQEIGAHRSRAYGRLFYSAPYVISGA